LVSANPLFATLPVLINISTYISHHLPCTSAVWLTVVHVLASCAAGDKLFFDKRDGGPLDLLTVNETAPEAVPEDKDSINGVQQLSLEATAINQNLSQQVRDMGSV